MAENTTGGLFSGPNVADLRRRRRENFMNQALAAGQGGGGAKLGSGLATLATGLMGGPSDTQQISRAQKMQQARQQIQERVGGIQGLLNDQSGEKVKAAQDVFNQLGLSQEAQRLPLEIAQARKANLQNEKTQAEIDALNREAQGKQSRAITAVAGTPKAKALEKKFGVTVPEGGTFEVKLENGVPQGVQRIAEERRPDVTEQQIVTSGETDLGKKAGLNPGERGRVSFQETEDGRIVTGVDLREQGEKARSRPKLGDLRSNKANAERVKRIGDDIIELAGLETTGTSGTLGQALSAIEADLKGLGEMTGLNFSEDVENAATVPLGELGNAEKSGVLKSAFREMVLAGAKSWSGSEDIDRQTVEQYKQIMGIEGDAFAKADPSSRKAKVGRVVRSIINDTNTRIEMYNNQVDPERAIGTVDMANFEVKSQEDREPEGFSTPGDLESASMDDLKNISDSTIDEWSPAMLDAYMNRYNELQGNQ